MACIGKDEEIKILVGPLEGFYHQISVIGRHVVVETAVSQQKFSFQILDQQLISLFLIVRDTTFPLTDETIVTFAPVILIIAIVVISRL